MGVRVNQDGPDDEFRLTVACDDCGATARVSIPAPSKSVDDTFDWGDDTRDWHLPGNREALCPKCAEVRAYQEAEHAVAEKARVVRLAKKSGHAEIGDEVVIDTGHGPRVAGVIAPGPAGECQLTERDFALPPPLTRCGQAATLNLEGRSEVSLTRAAKAARRILSTPPPTQAYGVCVEPAVEFSIRGAPGEPADRAIRIDGTFTRQREHANTTIGRGWYNCVDNATLYLCGGVRLDTPQVYPREIMLYRPVVLRPTSANERADSLSL